MSAHQYTQVYLNQGVSHSPNVFTQASCGRPSVGFGSVSVLLLGFFVSRYWNYCTTFPVRPCKLQRCETLRMEDLAITCTFSFHLIVSRFFQVTSIDIVSDIYMHLLRIDICTYCVDILKL